MGALKSLAYIFLEVGSRVYLRLIKKGFSATYFDFPGNLFGNPRIWAAVTYKDESFSESEVNIRLCHQCHSTNDNKEAQKQVVG